MPLHICFDFVYNYKIVKISQAIMVDAFPYLYLFLFYSLCLVVRD
jgi:hypothetical protein